MPKIQILNEKQVSHFVDTLSPELILAFDTRADELRAQAKKEQNNFITHEKVVKLKEEQKKELDKAEKILIISKSLKELDKDLYIGTSGWSMSLVSKDKDIDHLKERHEEIITEIIYELSVENLHVDNSWNRREQMLDELRARLCTTEIATFDEIKSQILASIKIDSYFTTKINN